MKCRSNQHDIADAMVKLAGSRAQAKMTTKINHIAPKWVHTSILAPAGSA
jgi:hypothetical protein